MNKTRKKILFITLTIVLFVPVALVISEFSLHTFRHIRLAMAPRDTVTFYVLGGSTSNGNPYFRRPNFASLVRDALGGKFKGLKINVETIARGGKTLSSNIYDFKKHLFLRPQRNAIILAYIGINEAVSNTYEKEEENIFWEKIFHKSIVGSALYAFYEQLRTKREFFGNIGNSLFLYENRLQELARLGHYSGHPIYLSELLTNIHDAPYSNSCSSRGTSRLSPEQFKQGVICEMKSVSEQKIQCYKDLKKRNKKFPFLDFHISREIYRANPTPENIKELNKVSYFGCSLYQKNKIVRKIANKNSNVTLIPIVEKFQSFDGGFLGYNLYGDGWHPNLQGMAIIAEQFLYQLVGPQYRIHSLSQIEKRYEIDTKERQKDILWHDINVAFGSALNVPGRFYFFHRMKKLIKDYAVHDKQMAEAMDFLIHPFLPIHSNIKKSRPERQVILSLHNNLINQLHENPWAKEKYLSAVKLAKDASLISRELYNEYLFFLDPKGQ